MTLLLTNAEVERALPMADCLAGMEEAYKDLGRARAATGVRSEILTPTTREDALYSLLTMNGAVPAFGVSAVRINSDILTWPAGEGSLKRVKVPSAPGGRYVGLVLLFSTETGEPLAVYPDGIVQRMRVGATSGLAAKYLAREDARTVALLGAGWQAGGQAMAIAAVRPGDRDPLLQPARRKPGSLRGGHDAPARHQGGSRVQHRGSRCRRRHRAVRDQQHAPDPAAGADRARHAREQPQAPRTRPRDGGARRRRLHPRPWQRIAHRTHRRRRSRARHRAPEGLP